MTNDMNLRKDQIELKLLEIIAHASFTRVLANSIQMTDRLNDIGIDSLAFMEMIVSIEEAFNVTVADEDLVMERFEKVESVRDYIIAKSN